MGRSGAAGSAPRTGDPVKARRARSEATARRWIIERLLRDRETPEAAKPPEKYLRTGREMVSGVSRKLSALQPLGELLGPLLVGGGRVRSFQLAAGHRGHLEITLGGSEAVVVKGVPGLAPHDGLQVLNALLEGLVDLAQLRDLTVELVGGGAELALRGLELHPLFESPGEDSRDGDENPDRAEREHRMASFNPAISARAARPAAGWRRPGPP